MMGSAYPRGTTMPLKSDTRSQLNLKGARITPNFLALLKKAIERNGQRSVTDFVVDTMTAECQRVLKGETSSGAALPARPEDVADQLAAQVKALLADELERNRAALDLSMTTLAAEVRADREEQQRTARLGRWKKR